MKKCLTVTSLKNNAPKIKEAKTGKDRRMFLMAVNNNIEKINGVIHRNAEQLLRGEPIADNIFLAWGGEIWENTEKRFKEAGFSIGYYPPHRVFSCSIIKDNLL